AAPGFRLPGGELNGTRFADDRAVAERMDAVAPGDEVLFAPRGADDGLDRTEQPAIELEARCREVALELPARFPVARVDEDLAPVKRHHCERFGRPRPIDVSDDHELTSVNPCSSTARSSRLARCLSVEATYSVMRPQPPSLRSASRNASSA